MKKILISVLLILSLCMCMVGMTACGGAKAQPNFEVPEGGYDGSAVTITFYTTMGTNLTPVLEEYIVEFNKLYPNITVVYESVGGYDDVRDQIKTEITVGNQPNIAYCYPDHVALYNLAGAVATLDNLIESDIPVTLADGTTEILGLTEEQKNDFIKGFYDEGAQFGDGLMYTMPFSKSTEVLYYNKTFFEANGLTVPTTWDELETVCAAIKTIDPNSIPLGYDSEANWFITMCEQLETDYTSATKVDGTNFLFDNDENKEFVKRFNEWYQKGYLTTQTLYGSYTSGLFTAQTGTRSYMSIGSSAGATHQRPAKNADGSYPFEVGIAPIPQMDAVNNPKVISQGPSVCIFKKDNPQEVVASWLFVKFLTTSTEFQADFSMASGYVPVLKSVANDPTYKDFTDKADGGDYVAALSAKVCLEQESYYYTSPAFNGSSMARDQVGALLTKLLTETALTDDVMDRAFRDAIDECEYSQ
ncbi:MAG: extracellular solute-binding protein [Clostridia bacterium]|nr:extracellular solute-binding protein [Clostridia bacterium]